MSRTPRSAVAVVSILAAVLAAGFVTTPAAAVDDAVATAATTREVASDLMPATRSLSRSVHTYHYLNRSRAGLAKQGYVRPDHVMVEPYLRHKIGRFWDQGFYEPSPGNLVSALYVATDPVASRVFGGRGDHWALFEIVLGRGFRYLDLRTTSGERRAEDQLAAGLQRRLAEVGCPVRYAADLFLDRITRPCRALALEVLLLLDVDGLLYDFRAAPLSACGGEHRAGGFVLLRLEALDLPRVELMVRERREDGASAARRRVQGLFIRARAAGSLHKLLWSDFPPAEPPEPSAEWMRRHLFGCGAYPEDRLAGAGPDDPVTAWRATEAELRRRGAVDEQIADAVHQLAAALAARGERSAAKAAYRRALELQPDHVESLFDLAWLCLEGQDRNPREAVTLAERLVRVTHYRDRRSTVGWNWSKVVKGRASRLMAAAYAAAGQWEQARGYAYQHYETTAKQHEESATALTSRTVAEAARCRDRYRAEEPCEPPLARRWSAAAPPAVEPLNPPPPSDRTRR